MTKSLTAVDDGTSGFGGSSIEVVPRPESSLWDRMQQSNFFLSPSYVEEWLAHLSGDEARFAVSHGSSETFDSVFPMVRSIETTFGKELRVLKSVGWNSAWYPYSFWPQTAETAERFSSFLATTRSDWDAALVSCSRETAPAVERAAAQLGFRVTDRREKVLPFVPVDRTWSAYWEDREKWLRVNLQRFLRRGERAGGVEFRDAARHEDGDRILQSFIELHDRRWSRRGQRSKFATKDRHRAFLRSLTERCRQEGSLYAPYLELDGEPIAIAICVLHGGKIYYVWPTFDVRHSRLAPGKLLLYYIIKEAFERKLSEVDLGPGADEYKFYWTSESRIVTRFLVHRGDRLVRLKYEALPHWKKRLRSGLQAVVPRKALDRIHYRLASTLERLGLNG